MAGQLQARSTSWQASNANHYGFLTTPRDLARLGPLVLMEGNWGDLNMFGTSQWFPLSVTPSQDSNPAYGFLWWLNGTTKHRSSIGSKPHLLDGSLVPSASQDLIIAMGHEKRRLYISPGHKLVIVRSGSDPGRGFDEEFWMHVSKVMLGR